MRGVLQVLLLSLAVLLVKATIPVVFIHFNTCSEPHAVEQAAIIAGKVIYVGEQGCHFLAPQNTEITYMDVNALQTTETSKVAKIYPPAASSGLAELKKTFEVQCITRHFILREVMRQTGLDMVAYLDHDVMLYIPPDTLLEKVTEAMRIRPDIVLATSNDIAGAAYTSMWTLDGITSVCAFILEAMTYNPKVAFNDMQLTALYYNKSRDLTVDITLPRASAPFKVALLTDIPGRDAALELTMGDNLLIFDPKFHDNETSMLLLPPNPHPRTPHESVEVKRVFFCDRSPMLYDTKTEQFVAVGALHFRGPCKDMQQFYLNWKKNDCVCDDVLCSSCLPMPDFFARMPELTEKYSRACKSDSDADTDVGDEGIDEELY